MKENKKNPNAVVSGMPETIFSKTTATRVRDSVEDAISDLHFAVLDLRRAGVPIETVKDVKEISRNSIKAQLEKDKEAYFKNMRFVPAGLRRQVNQEFADMEATLLPLVDQIVNARKRVPVSYSVNIKDEYKTGEHCIKCDDKELDDYIDKAATITILPEYREYYEAIAVFCKSWEKMCKEAQSLNIEQPDRHFLDNIIECNDLATDDLTELRKPQMTQINITPEKMFQLISSGVVRMKAPK